ncbi:MAG: hypothetical protein ACREX3_12705 [Gammaproteobacteria bacterium]
MFHPLPNPCPDHPCDDCLICSSGTCCLTARTVSQATAAILVPSVADELLDAASRQHRPRTSDLLRDRRPGVVVDLVPATARRAGAADQDQPNDVADELVGIRGALPPASPPDHLLDGVQLLSDYVPLEAHR